MGDPSTTSINTMPAPQKQYSVLFVCLGNICRSPMAEGTFRSLTNFNSSNPNPVIKEIDSCGTGAYHAGDPPDSRTISVLSQHKIRDYDHFARKVRIPEDFKEYDFLLGMDADNVLNLREMAKKATSRGLLTQEEGEEAQKRIRLYGEFGGKSKREEVDDPYYGGRNGFEIAYEQVTRFGKGLLKTIEEEAGKADGA